MYCNTAVLKARGFRLSIQRRVKGHYKLVSEGRSEADPAGRIVLHMIRPWFCWLYKVMTLAYAVLPQIEMIVSDC